MPTPTANDIANAAQRLRDILRTRVPSGDYEEGSALSDLVIDPTAMIYADMAQQSADLRARQSLVALSRAPASADVDEATDAILGNLYVSRAQGSFARGTCTVHITQRVDTAIPRNARFFKTGSLVFFLNSPSSLFVPASSMRQIRDATGRAVTWAFDVPLIAARTGAVYEIASGRFLGVDAFTPYFAYAENASDFAGGLDIETSSALVSRAGTALSLRALINERSNDARLREVFPEVSGVLTIGMGDPEMVRDTLRAEQGVGLRAHLGGYADIFVDLPIHEVTEALIVEQPTARPDGLILTFRDPSPPTGSFSGAGVLVGDVFVLAAGLPEAPAQYKVAAVRDLELDMVPSVPFSRATEEDVTPPSITYSVGNAYPGFANHVAARTSSSARTSRLLSAVGCVVLPAQPIYEITRVEILTPPPALASFVDPGTGSVLYTARRSAPLARTPIPGEPLSYRVRGMTPQNAQSSKALNLLEVAWAGINLAGTEVSVTYKTPVGFTTAQDMVSDRRERVLNGNQLVRARHPIYVSFTISYRGRTVPSGIGTALGAVDEQAVVAALLVLVRSAAPGALDVTALTTAAVVADANVGALYAFNVLYELLLPDGRVAKYSTSDFVEILPRADSTATLLNYAELGLSSAYLNGLRTLLVDQGVSDRVVCYQSDTSRITMERRS